MTKPVGIADFALVTVLDRAADTSTQLHQLLSADAAFVTGNVNNPGETRAKVEAHLEAGRTVLLHLPHSHPKIRRDMSRVAHTHGALSVVLAFEEAEIDAAEKHDAVYGLLGHSVDDLAIYRERMPNDLRHITGGIDFIGDIHGCATELAELLVQLGHAVPLPQGGIDLRAHPEGRRVAFVGDLTDRGPQNLRALWLARRLHQQFGAIAVLGNHDFKLMRWLRGAKVRVAAGLARTIDELERLSDVERAQLADWLASLQMHYVLDGGRVVIAHAGLAEQFHGRKSKAGDSFALFGDKTEEADEEGIPVIRDWAARYQGEATVVHGHVVTPEPRILNKVVSIDTGCVFGGKLTAFRYPEGEFVAVKAKETYFEPRNRQIAA